MLADCGAGLEKAGMTIITLRGLGLLKGWDYHNNGGLSTH